MADFRISKYDPSKRDFNGKYLLNEWTSISDIGKEYNGVVFTERDYLATEAAYIECAVLFCHLAKIRKIGVQELEIYQNIIDVDIDIDNNTINIYNDLKINKTFRASELEYIMRLNLREIIWCKLTGERDFYIHFGYDYIMYIGGTALQKNTSIVPGNLFIEHYKSPYLK